MDATEPIGLSSDQLHRPTVFVSLVTRIVVTRILYALPAWGVFASVGQIGRIDAFLRRAYKCGISKDLFTFEDLLRDSQSLTWTIKYIQNVGRGQWAPAHQSS